MLNLVVPRVATGEKNTPTAAYAGRTRAIKWVPSASRYTRRDTKVFRQLL